MIPLAAFCKVLLPVVLCNMFMICLAEQATNIFLTHLNLSPDIKSTFRLGRPLPSKPQPLLISLKSPAEAEQIISHAKNLRLSNSQFIRDHIFINRHLTRAESQAAYETRLNL